MLKIDAHQHFWQFDPVRDSWINDEMQAIQRDFLPGDLYPLLQQNGFDGCVVVQSDQTVKETDFQLKNAASHDFIKGVVGWVDLQAEDVREQLEAWSRFDKLKGFRHVLQGEADEQFMLRPAFKRGISALHQFDFTYDILIFPNHLKFAKELVAAFPLQRFVIDHLAKPYIKAGKIEEWKKDMETIAVYENVCCKVSGMVTEADWKNWKKDDFFPYLDVVFHAFGNNRLMFGSDWPVCTVAATYGEVIGLLTDYLAPYSTSEKSAFWGGNAVDFYKL